MGARRSLVFVCLLAWLVATVPTPSGAQSTSDLQAIRAELEALRKSQEATAKEVAAIRALLQQAMGPRPASEIPGAANVPGAPLPPQPPPIKIAGRPVRGSAQAKLVMIEFGDYECPFCGQYATAVYPTIDRDYIRTNKIRYVFKSFPVEQIHPRAFKAHEAAACAGDQGKYWEMHDKIFADQANLALDRFIEHGLALGLDAAKLRNCIEGPAHEAEIREDIQEAVAGGVRGTPVFVFAYADARAQTVTPARVLMGAQPLQAFKATLDELLATAPSTPVR